MKYLYLASITFVGTIVLGAIAVLVIPVSKWIGLLSNTKQFLLQFEFIKRRYDVSVFSCGDCSDIYLFTVWIFASLTIFYFVVLIVAIFTRWRRRIMAITTNEYRPIPWKSLSMPLLLAFLSFMITFSLLFSSTLAQPSLASPSNSSLSMFGLMLILLVNIAFHTLVVTVMGMVAVIMRR